MNADPIPMDDDGGALAHQCALEYEQWLDELAHDAAARAEYEQWAATQSNSTRTGRDHENA